MSRLSYAVLYMPLRFEMHIKLFQIQHQYLHSSVIHPSNVAGNLWEARVYSLPCTYPYPSVIMPRSWYKACWKFSSPTIVQEVGGGLTRMTSTSVSRNELVGMTAKFRRDWPFPSLCRHLLMLTFQIITMPLFVDVSRIKTAWEHWSNKPTSVALKRP